ncbi:glycosyltransferase [Cereibacter sphaeroides]|uniref:glycosyltransferase n=1 Tax=Cereibacter sphaeroides TaxID=1063 RepID=UPI003FCD4F77
MPLSLAVLTASLSDRAGGLAATVPASINAVKRFGVKAHVFGLRDAGTNYAARPLDGADVHAIPSWPTPGLRLAPALDRELRKVQADVLHLHGLWLYPSIAALRWRARSGRPVMISPHGMLDGWALNNSAWKKRLALMLFEQRNLSGAACLHALADNERMAIRALGVSAPVAVIPNGVDIPAVGGRRSKPAFLKGEERRVLLFLGRIHPKKGLAETLQAWALVLSGAPQIERDWVLVIAGWDDGGHVEPLKRLAKDLGVDGSVCFGGPIFGDEKVDLLCTAEAFILASHSEGLPMAVLEAWAHACPVFMTRACNLPEGFAADAAIEISTHPPGMAKVLLQHLARSDLPYLGLAGKALVADRFSWDRVGRDFAAVYYWLAQRGDRPDCVQITVG